MKRAIAVFILVGIGALPAGAAKTCVEGVLTRDSAAGESRNHGTESSPLADVIEAYVAEVRAADWTGCPEPFKAAFKDHLAAWESMAELFVDDDGRRGELHTLFDEIAEQADEIAAKQFKDRLDEIWKTWATVESTAQAEPTP